MRKAYDTFLQSEVSSDLAAKSGGLEPYRYECLHCGEEVRLAAMDSTSMIPHFRHRSGNNDVECEKYLGQYGIINPGIYSRKSKNERVEFYFDNVTRMFYLGLCFSNDEIKAYEQEAAIFELREFEQEQAFFSLFINNRNFDPDVPRMIPIEKFSNDYFVSNSFTGIKRKYELFKRMVNDVPTFFKIQGNDSNFKAKLVRSTILYTNIPYFVVFRNQHTFLKDIFSSDNVKVKDTFQFKTMEKKFFGKILIIRKKTASIDSLIKSWGYQLEISEILTLLWPPAVQVGENSLIHSEQAFLFSSFELETHGNINVHSENIIEIEKGISMISVKSKVKIYKKNMEMTISKGEQDYRDFDSLVIVKNYYNIYKIPDNNIYFLFNKSGVTPLYHGQTISLTPNSIIKYYQFGYQEGAVYPLQQHRLFGEKLLNDLLAHYKRTESFTINVFESFDLSEIASQYIKKCSESGIINSAAKYFIEEGWL